MKYVRGDEPGSARTIRAMLNNLPEGSRFVAIMSAPDDDRKPAPLDAETEAMLDRKLWTPDRILQAQLINAVRDLTVVAGRHERWKADKAPTFPLVGPKSWREPGTDKPKHTSKPTSVDDVFNRMMGR